MNQITLPVQKRSELISQDIINSIVQEIVNQFSPLQIIIFGSYAIGNPNPESDLDILIIMDTDLPKYKRATEIHLIFQPSPCAIDILVYTPEEIEKWKGTVNHIVTEIFRSGKVVYERK